MYYLRSLFFGWQSLPATCQQEGLPLKNPQEKRRKHPLPHSPALRRYPKPPPLLPPQRRLPPKLAHLQLRQIQMPTSAVDRDRSTISSATSPKAAPPRCWERAPTGHGGTLNSQVEKAGMRGSPGLSPMPRASPTRCQSSPRHRLRSCQRPHRRIHRSQPPPQLQQALAELSSSRPFLYFQLQLQRLFSSSLSP